MWVVSMAALMVVEMVVERVDSTAVTMVAMLGGNLVDLSVERRAELLAVSR